MLRDRCRESRRVGGHDVAPHSHRGPCAATDLVVAAHRTGELDSCLSQVEYAVRSVWRPAGPDVCDAESTVSPSVTVGATPRTEVGSRLPTGALPTGRHGWPNVLRACRQPPGTSGSGHTRILSHWEAKKPFSRPMFVPRERTRATTRSPSATMASISKVRSGNWEISHCTVPRIAVGPSTV